MAVIGGGLGGLTSALMLAKWGIRVVVVEKKAYPFHRVCGEYLSKEVVPFLKSLDAYPSEFNPASITKFLLTSVNGRSFQTSLDQGGLGISRFNFDNYLYGKAKNAGSDFMLHTRVENISFPGDGFVLRLSDGTDLSCKLLIGAHGKKSRIDNILERKFTHHYSPYLGVKYHIRYDFPHDVIALHNFIGGYCGLVKIEEDKYNLCYLASRKLLKQSGSIPQMESVILSQNPFLKDIFTHADFLFDKPLVINEFTFEPKLPVENHILMVGDAAGLITPLCGNGMAMAIHSGKIAAESIANHFHNGLPEYRLIEQEYEYQWKNAFNRRLQVGRQVQKLFGGINVSSLSVNLMKKVPLVSRWIIRNTHGKEF